MGFAFIKHDTNLDFIGKRHWAYALSALLILVGIASMPDFPYLSYRNAYLLGEGFTVRDLRFTGEQMAMAAPNGEKKMPSLGRA